MSGTREFPYEPADDAEIECLRRRLDMRRETMAEHVRLGDFATIEQAEQSAMTTIAYTEARALLARLDKAEERWQDISTAPKDFVTTIDMWWQGERLADCFWMRPTYGPKEYMWCRYAYDDSNGPVYNEIRGATHWRHLPAPPVGSGRILADATPNSPNPLSEP